MGIESALPAGNNDDITTATNSALTTCGLCCKPLRPPLLLFCFPCCKKHICDGCRVDYESSDHAGQSHKCPYCRTQYRPEPFRPEEEDLGDSIPGPPTPRAGYEVAMERHIMAERAARHAAGGQGWGGEEEDEDDEEEDGDEGGVGGGRVRRRWRRLREGMRRRLRRGRRGGVEEEEEDGEEEDEE